jgi:hypothetical protein
MSIRFKTAAVVLGLITAATSFSAASAEVVVVKHRRPAARIVVAPHRIAPRVVIGPRRHVIRGPRVIVR